MNGLSGVMDLSLSRAPKSFARASPHCIFSFPLAQNADVPGHLWNYPGPAVHW